MPAGHSSMGHSSPSSHSSSSHSSSHSSMSHTSSHSSGGSSFSIGHSSPTNHSSSSLGRGSSHGGSIFGGGPGGPDHRPGGPDHRPGGPRPMGPGGPRPEPRPREPFGPMTPPPPPRRPFFDRYTMPPRHHIFTEILDDMVRYHCMNHDYVYIPTARMYGGVWREAGYYDESGNYYTTININKDTKSTKITCKCDYCGASTVVDFSTVDDIKAIKCSSCGANLDITNKGTTDYVVGSGVNTSTSMGSFSNPYGGSSSRDDNTNKIIKIFLIVLMIVLAVALMKSCIAKSRNNRIEQYNQRYEQGAVTENYENNTNVILGDVIYVSEIGRNMATDSDGNWFDDETGCFLYYNEDTETLQYWYRGISEDYESGWMEWDENENQWYIETDYGTWEELELSSDDRSRVWHTTYERLLNDNR